MPKLNHTVAIDSFEANHENGCITAIIAGRNRLPITAWGCEVGNWHGFFSQEKLGGSSVAIIFYEVKFESNHIETRFEFNLPGGRFSVNTLEYLVDGVINRIYSLRAIEDLYIGDFVIRSGTDSNHWNVARIGNKCFFHRSRNIMHQLPISEALISNSKFDIRFFMENQDNFIMPSRFDALTYVRDEPGGSWIIHHRLLTRYNACDEYVFRIRNRLWSNLQHPLISSRFIRRIFWRLSERYSFIRPTTQVGGNVILEKGETLQMRSIVSLRMNRFP